MTPESRIELEGLVEELRALAPRLRRHGQPLATQLLEMAVLEIRSQIYGIDDEELQALVDTLSGQKSQASEATETLWPAEQSDGPTGMMPPARVFVALGEISRSKRKRRI